MRFLYGKQDWSSFERGQENCYLLTNGLGGFSSATIVGSNARNDHAFFMACIKSPNQRMNLIQRLEEHLFVGEREVEISTQEYMDKEKNQEGFQNQISFLFEDYPVWTYGAEGVELVKSIAMKQGENTIAVQYEIANCTDKDVVLTITPWMEFVPKGKRLDKAQLFLCTETYMESSGMRVYFRTDGEWSSYDTEYREDFFYRYDSRDGRDFRGCAARNHDITFRLSSKENRHFEIVYSMDPVKQIAEEIIKNAIEYRKRLAETSQIGSEIGQMLAKSANQFIAERESTGGKTILAGYPFFEDWGRDTMIAAVGCCIAAKQWETAKSIFHTFLQYCRRGIMPNLFPEGDHPPMYNTADASLIFINTVYLYDQAAKDKDFIEEAYPVMEEIVEWYQNGTDFGIHADEDGLMMAGQGLDQVTWMDVRIGEILPTPRHGKPVEINAYWYSALKIMEEFTKRLGKAEKLPYEKMAEKAKQSFCEKFWNEEKKCLRDVLSGTEADDQIRCNQIWAISMPYTMLPEEKERQVVETVFEKLYTPYGLLTLEKGDPQFHPFYGGEQKERDLAYHQGTIWTFLLGAYYLAYLKTHHYDTKAKETVKRQLLPLESAMREGCVGQLPEIYDGNNPVFSKGCFAQAWSVGELLRVYEAVEKNGFPL